MRAKGKGAGKGTRVICLSAPGMTSLHRVGLAGLWLTLRALEREPHAVARLRKAGGEWERSSTSVVFRWAGDGKRFFAALFEESFRIEKGLIWFPALGRPSAQPGEAVVLHGAILGSFLQHGRTRALETSSGEVSFEVDGAPFVLLVRKVKRYSHQDAAFSVETVNRLAGWHFPGGTVRHVGLGETSTALADPPARTLALRFAPVGAIYFEVRRRGGGARPRYAVVLPEVRDLEWYGQVRACFLKFAVQRLRAAGAVEAGFRVLATLHAAGLLQDIGSQACRVVSFGTVPWSARQRTRVGLFTVNAGSEAALRTFAVSQAVLPPTLVRRPGHDPFWDVPQVPELVARNLSAGRDWWSGFADFVADQECRKHVFSYERGGLASMIQDTAVLPDGPERAFVMACHEAWRRRMAQIGERSRREHTPFTDLVNREYERVRVGFARCKNEATLREAVTGFWARAGGPLPGLQSGWQDVLPLLDHGGWRKGRDLALLALASYRPASRDEEAALTVAELNEPQAEEEP